jgi:hypothetical protein
MKRKLVAVAVEKRGHSLVDAIPELVKKHVASFVHDYSVSLKSALQGETVSSSEAPMTLLPLAKMDAKQIIKITASPEDKDLQDVVFKRATSFQQALIEIIPEVIAVKQMLDAKDQNIIFAIQALERKLPHSTQAAWNPNAYSSDGINTLPYKAVRNFVCNFLADIDPEVARMFRG